MPAELVPMPTRGHIDIPAGLRALADQIEKGEYGVVTALAWITDPENRPVDLGLLGSVPQPDTLFITLCELAKTKLIAAMGKAKNADPG